MIDDEHIDLKIVEGKRDRDIIMEIDVPSSSIDKMDLEFATDEAFRSNSSTEHTHRHFDEFVLSTNPNSIDVEAFRVIHEYDSYRDEWTWFFEFTTQAVGKESIGPFEWKDLVDHPDVSEEFRQLILRYLI